MCDEEKLVLKRLRVVYIPEWQAKNASYMTFDLSEHHIWVDSLPKELAEQIKAFVEKWERFRDEMDV